MSASKLKAKRRSYTKRLPDFIEHKFETGREKYGDSWINSEPRYMLDRMEEEFYEFRQAVEHDRDPDEAIRELADICNFGLMYMVLSLWGDGR